MNPHPDQPEGNPAGLAVVAAFIRNDVGCLPIEAVDPGEVHAVLVAVLAAFRLIPFDYLIYIH